MAHVTLRQGNSALTLSPDYGAAILRFTHDGQDIFKPVEPGWKGGRDPLKTACFPLIPYSNRIRDGQFSFDGKEISLDFPDTGHAHALHGLGWVRPWTVIQQSDSACLCTFEHAADMWPWAFRATQSLVLSDGQLSLTLSITNESESDMPAGLGPHPYFPNKKNASLKCHADGVWLSDGDALPISRATVLECWDFARGRTLNDVIVDNCFTGFTGHAQIRWDGKPYGVNITADAAFGFAVIYVPEEQDYFCFEPVSHMNDAVNFDSKIPTTGLRVLSPGERFSATTLFTITGGS